MDRRVKRERKAVWRRGGITDSIGSLVGIEPSSLQCVFIGSPSPSQTIYYAFGNILICLCMERDEGERDNVRK